MTKDSINTTAPRAEGPRADNLKVTASQAVRIAVFSSLALAATGVAAADQVATGPIADAAKAVLEQHCARCHESTQLKEGLDRPQGKFGFVLDLDRVVSKRLVIPGNASGSTLMRQIENGSMPKDMSSDCYLFPPPDDAYCGPTAEEVAALRSWIDGLNNPDLAVAEATAPAVDAASEPATETASEPEAEQTPTAETVAEQAPAEGGAERSTEGTSLADAIAERAQDEQPQTAEATAAAPEPAVQAAAPRGFISDEEIIEAMALDLAKVPEARQKTQRYLTLTHLYNAGDEDEALEVYRMAIAKLLNSLSRKPDPVIPVVVNEAKTILRFDMQDLGWASSLWDKVAEANPYFLQYDNNLYESLQRDTGTKMPFVRADWFAFVGSQPPLYHDLLGLPESKAELEKMLGINVLENIDSLDVARAGFQRSGVSQSNRMVERHQMATGAYWESYDFAGNAGKQDFFTHPLGPTTAFKDEKLGEKYGFEHDGGEVIFALPNGFHAYYLTTGDNKRLDQGPTSIVRDDSRRDAAVTNGISCMGCHDQGMKYNPYRPAEAHDEVRDIVLANISNPKEMRDVVEEIFPPHEEFHALMQTDAEAYRAALERAGIKMGAKYDGLEMVNALFARFEEDVTADLAAAEFGFTKEEFFERLGQVGGNAYTMKIRLSQDRIPRDQFVKVYAEMANKITDHAAISLEKVAEAAKDTVKESEARPADAAKTFDLEFVPTTETYKVGDTVNFTVKSAKPCYLTLVNVDDKDRVQIVFPNKFNQANEIEAGRTYTIPSDEIGGFKFLFAEPGAEKVIAICNASRPTPRGIAHAFDSADYTTFRSIDEFTNARLLSVEADAAKGEATPATGEAKTEATAEVKTEAVAEAKTDDKEALVENKIDPEVDIVAQKAVVLKVEAK